MWGAIRSGRSDGSEKTATNLRQINALQLREDASQLQIIQQTVTLWATVCTFFAAVWPLKGTMTDMAATAKTLKKVIIRFLDGSIEVGHLPQSGFAATGNAELLGADGKVKTLAISEIKTISYVRDLALEDAELLSRKSFAARPKMEGMWLRLSFRDGDSLEGVTESDLGFVDALLEDRGIFLTPPDGRSNTLRVFVPRSALQTVEVIGLIAPAARRGTSKIRHEGQTGLFGE